MDEVTTGITVTDSKTTNLWYSIGMTKLQSIVAEIKALPVDEQRVVVSEFTHLITPAEDDIFELTDAELADLDDRIKNDTVTFTHEEVMDALRATYASDTSTK